MLDYLKDEINSCMRPMEPDGPEWPNLRAFKDGQAKQAIKMLTWLNGRCNHSPDEAQNTED